MRVLLDTNVIVSAVTTRGLCADVFRTVLAEHELITSPALLQEVRRVLTAKFAVPERLVAQYLELIQQAATNVEPATIPDVPLKDQDDLAILAAALAAHAQVLVTGDRELQSLHRLRKVRILSPREFWEELAGVGSPTGSEPC
jgi:putative PIN family toxin of toxin-antitoxin system